MSSTITVKLTALDFDYLQDALDLMANYGSNARSDRVGKKLVDAWNAAQSKKDESKKKKRNDQ